MCYSKPLWNQRALRFAARRLIYLAWQVFALTARSATCLLFACYALALLAIGLIATCAPLCAARMCFGANGQDATFTLFGLYGVFLLLLTVRSALWRVVDYALTAPEGALLHPVPPLCETPAPDAKALLRASCRGSNLLLRVVSAPPSADAPALLLRAANGERSLLRRDATLPETQCVAQVEIK